MKKTGLAAIAFVLLMGCGGGANDGKLGTDTTTFPSHEVKSDTATKGLGDVPDSSDRMPNTMFKNTSPTTRSTTPGNKGKDSTQHQ